MPCLESLPSPPSRSSSCCFSVPVFCLLFVRTLAFPLGLPGPPRTISHLQILGQSQLPSPFLVRGNTPLLQGSGSEQHFLFFYVYLLIIITKSPILFLLFIHAHSIPDRQLLGARIPSSFNRAQSGLQTDPHCFPPPTPPGVTEISFTKLSEVKDSHLPVSSYTGHLTH